MGKWIFIFFILVCILVWFPYSEDKIPKNSNNKKSLPKKIKNTNFLEQINSNIVNILWFYDGKFKNIEVFEPSAISLKLEINTKKNAEPLGYYPSYENMSPSQRYIYLNWLKDITKPIDIGYVFTFYYGLERHLFYGDYLGAVNIIKTLKEHHSNSSFQAYSTDALMSVAIKRKNMDILRGINYDNLSSELKLFFKAVFNVPLTSEEIIEIARKVNFTNTRYIKNEKSKFTQILNKKIDNSFKIEKHYIDGITSNFPVVIANYSLSSDERINSLPNLFSSEPFTVDVHNLLSDTHNELKALLALERKSESTSNN